VRVADGEPGAESQVDFGRMGLLFDSVTDRRRVCWALIFTACYSRHCFMWLSSSQTLDTVIEGFEAGWAFFGGVLKVIIPDNMKTVVDQADRIDARLNQAFVEYAPGPGVRDRPGPGPHAHRQAPRGAVPFVRNSVFAGESFMDLADAQRRAEQWCLGRAGQRTHGTTACPPVELFMVEEQPRLLPAPAQPYDLPVYATAKVHRDHHIEIGRALYSVPGDLIGARVEVRAGRQLVRVSHRGVLVKVHPRQAPGGRVTDAEDLPAHKSAYVMWDLDHLVDPHRGVPAPRPTYLLISQDQPFRSGCQSAPRTLAR
jgi:hypothetical protein